MKTNICDPESSLFRSLCCCFNTVVYFCDPNKTDSTDCVLNSDISILKSIHIRASLAVLKQQPFWMSDTIRWPSFTKISEKISCSVCTDFNMLKAQSSMPSWLSLWTQYRWCWSLPWNRRWRDAWSSDTSVEQCWPDGLWWALLRARRAWKHLRFLRSHRRGINWIDDLDIR